MRNCNFILLLSGLLLFGCGQGNSGQKIQSIDSGQESDYEMNCWGIGKVQLDMDYESLLQTVGEKDMSIDSAYTAEHKFKGFVSRLWKGRPEEISVYWRELKQPFQNIDSLEISGPKSPYKFFNGLKIGSSLSDIVKLNDGENVMLSSFNQSHTANILSIEGRKLKGDIPCFGGSLALPDSVSASEMQHLTGDDKISSSRPEVRRHDPKLCRISIRSI